MLKYKVDDVLIFRRKGQDFKFVITKVEEAKNDYPLYTLKTIDHKVIINDMSTDYIVLFEWEVDLMMPIKTEMAKVLYK